MHISFYIIMCFTILLIFRMIPQSIGLRSAWLSKSLDLSMEVSSSHSTVELSIKNPPKKDKPHIKGALKSTILASE